MYMYMYVISTGIVTLVEYACVCSGPHTKSDAAGPAVCMHVN